MKYVIRELANGMREGVIFEGTLRGAKCAATRRHFFEGAKLHIEIADSRAENPASLYYQSEPVALKVEGIWINI